MARQKPLDPAIVEEWLAAWESGPSSDAAVRHLLSLITDPFCIVVVTLGVGREPRSLVFLRIKQMILASISPTSIALKVDSIALKPTEGFASLTAIRKFAAWVRQEEARRLFNARQPSHADRARLSVNFGTRPA
jgi:hypothetical protein